MPSGRIYSESPEIRHPPHRAGALHGLGELQGHDSLQGQQHHNLGLAGRVGENAELEEEVDTERVRVHPRRSGFGYGGEMGGTTNARIDIRVDERTSKKNNTHTLEMSDMWATERIYCDCCMIYDLFYFVFY